MAKGDLGTVLRYIHRFAGSRMGCDVTDRQLLDLFAGGHEEAFAALLKRHGGLVLGVCRRVLHNAEDADDAFQATFLVLARKTRSIAWQDSVANWLYETAYRLASDLKGKTARRRAREREAVAMAKQDSTAAQIRQELVSVLDEELQGLPSRLRKPLLLCYFEDQTGDEAAKRLGWSLRTLQRRLHQGRQQLRARLARRGWKLPAALIASELAQQAARAAMSATQIAALTSAAMAFAAARPTAASIRPRAMRLAEGLLKDTLHGTLKTMTILVLAVALAGSAAGVLAYQGLLAEAPEAQADQKTAASTDHQPIAEPKSQAGSGQKDKQARTDRYGDPLPPGVLMRLGTVSLRHPEGICCVAFTPDGEQMVSGSMDGTIRFWDQATAKEVRRLESPWTLSPGVFGLAFSPDGRTLAAAENGDIIRVWDVLAGKERLDLRGASGACVAISPDGSLFASSGGGNRSESLALWDLAAGKKVRSLGGKLRQVHSVAFSPDGKTLAAARCAHFVLQPPKGLQPGVVQLWDVDSGELRQELHGHRGGVTAVAYSRDGKRLASASHDATICVWQTANHKLLRKIRMVEDPYTSAQGGGTKGIDRGGILGLAFSSDGQTLASANSDATVRLWNVGTGEQLRVLRNHTRDVLAVAFSGDGKRLASASYDHTASLWDPDSGKLLHARQGHNGAVARLVVSADGRRAVSAGIDRTVRFWDLTVGHELHVVRGFKSFEQSLGIAPDGKIIALGEEDGTIQLRETDTGREVRQLHGHTGPVYSLSFSPDGKLLASAAHREKTRSIRLWDLATGRELQRIDGNRDVYGIHFSPDGKLLATYTVGEGVDVWEAATGTKRYHFADLADFQFLPDGTAMVVRSKDGVVRLRSLTDGREVYTFQGPKRPNHVHSGLALSPDGRTLALKIEQKEKEIQLWEMATGKPRRTLTGHAGWITDCAFTPDGRALLSSSQDTTVLVWDIARKTEPAPRRLVESDLMSLWNDLAGQDSTRADRSIWGLATAPQQAVPLLQKHLRPAPPVERARLAAWVKDLASDRFTIRDKATHALADLENVAEPALRDALAGAPSLEVRGRIERLLSRLKRPLTVPHKIRDLRAVEVLEHIGTPAAKQLLQVLAQGAAEARLTKEARSSLERLGKRKAP